MINKNLFVNKSVECTRASSDFSFRTQRLLKILFTGKTTAACCQISAKIRVFNLSCSFPLRNYNFTTFCKRTAKMESQSTPSTGTAAVDTENCFKILLATDIHLGYKEKDVIIGK